MRRGDVYWADLVPRSGSKQTGRRPVVILSHDGFNGTPGWNSIVIVPISTSSSLGKRGPTVIEISGGAAGLPKTSFALCHEVTTLDRAKLTKRLGSLPNEPLTEIEGGAEGGDGSRLAFLVEMPTNSFRVPILRDCAGIGVTTGPSNLTKHSNCQYVT